MYYVQDKTDKKYQVWTKAIKFFCALKISQKKRCFICKDETTFHFEIANVWRFVIYCTIRFYGLVYSHDL